MQGITQLMPHYNGGSKDPRWPWRLRRLGWSRASCTVCLPLLVQEVLTKEFDRLVALVWIPGHTGTLYNECACALVWELTYPYLCNPTFLTDVLSTTPLSQVKPGHTVATTANRYLWHDCRVSNRNFFKFEFKPFGCGSGFGSGPLFHSSSNRFKQGQRTKR